MSAYAWRGGVVATSMPANGRLCLLPGDESIVGVDNSWITQSLLPVIVDVDPPDVAFFSSLDTTRARLEYAKMLGKAENEYYRRDDVNREIVYGLLPGKANGWTVLSGLLHGKQVAPTRFDDLLASVGIVETRVRSDRSDLAASLEGWPGATATETADYGGVPLRLCDTAMFLTRLLQVTKQRRMLAHLHEHRWVLQRLCSWRAKSLPTPSQLCGNDTETRFALGFGAYLDKLALSDFSYVHLGWVSSSATFDGAMHVGALLRAAANVMRLNAPDPTMTLDLSTTVNPRHQETPFSSVISELRALLGPGYARTLASNGGRILAPHGLRTYEVPAGHVLVYETPNEIPLARRREVKAVLGNLARVLGLSAAHASELRGPTSIGVTLGSADTRLDQATKTG